jgi:hypothetical protein
MDKKTLWNRVYVTDPAAVKKITGKDYGGSSPSPYWIIERLTDEFGPCGIGWGFNVVNERFERFSDTDTLHIACVRMWYELDGKRGELEQMGQTKGSYVTSKGAFKVDEDAPKKSVTDALVKCASYLGFAGDIFSGRWDDSKYVAEAHAEWADRRAAANESPEQKADRKAWEKRCAELDEFSLYLIDCHENSKDIDAIRAWYSPDSWSNDNPTDSEERKYVWHTLRAHSKLRSTIQSNKPEEKAAS